MLWLNNLLVILAILSLLRSTKPPTSITAWILALVALPYVGPAGYVLFGLERRGRRIVQFIPEEVFSELMRPGGVSAEEESVESFSESETGNDGIRNSRILQHTTALPIYRNNFVQSFYSGHEKFKALFTDIMIARESIDMEYYQWISDNLGMGLLETLASRAREGLKVRLLFDGVGSFGKISFAYRRRLQEAGISYAYFLDLSNPLARMKINYRNHRKIVVIDEKLAYIGGINVGDTYITGGKKFQSWRDTHLRIEGPAVAAVQCTFLVDWYNSINVKNNRIKKHKSRISKTNTQPSGRAIPEEIMNMRTILKGEIAFPPPNPTTSAFSSKHQMTVQIALSGPDSPWEGILMHYCELLSSAEKEVLIQTPYFIPGEAMEQALVSAALRGVKVKLMTMGNPPDNLFSFWIAQTYFPRLLKSGVEIFQYQKGLLHAKSIIKDREICSIGSCNVDLRSFHLAYELNAVIYNSEESERQAEQFYRDINNCRQISLKDYEKMPPLIQLRNTIMRVMAPIM